MGHYCHAMNSKPYFQIRPDGTVNVVPAPVKRATTDYSQKPVQYAVRHDSMRLELHGENFSTLINLSTDDALNIAMMLTYAVREALYHTFKTEFVEVSK